MPRLCYCEIAPRITLTFVILVLILPLTGSIDLLFPSPSSNSPKGSVPVDFYIRQGTTACVDGAGTSTDPYCRLSVALPDIQSRTGVGDDVSLIFLPPTTVVAPIANQPINITGNWASFSLVGDAATSVVT